MALGYGNSIIGLIALLCAIWVIYDVWANNKRRKSSWKVIWTIFAILFSILTAVIYYLVEKK